MTRMRAGKAIERYMFPMLIAIPVVLWSLCELWPALGEHEGISALADGVPVLSAPLPLHRSKEGVNEIIGELRQGDDLEIYREIYGKDYLMFEVRYESRRGYVQYDSRSIDWPRLREP